MSFEITLVRTHLHSSSRRTTFHHRLTFEPLEGRTYLSAVIGRNVFYNNSAFDGYEPRQTPSMITRLLPINRHYCPAGMRLSPTTPVLTAASTGSWLNFACRRRRQPDAADFQFKVGNDANPDCLADGAIPGEHHGARGAGLNGSDRVTIVWADGAIRMSGSR